MSAFPRRFKQVVERHGDAFTVSGSSRKGIFTLLGEDRFREFLSEEEIAAASLPIRLAYIAFDDPTAAADTVVWDGQNLTVVKAVNLRAKGETVARILVLE